MTDCFRCHRPLEILSRPVRRLWGTGYWLTGIRSLLAKPLRVCPQCGGIYTWEGTLLAAGATETADEIRLRAYRADMARLRDSFGAVVVAAELAVIWMWVGATSFPVVAPALAIVTGGLALVPFAYFSRKARQARSQLRQLREARVKGEPSTGD